MTAVWCTLDGGTVPHAHDLTITSLSGETAGLVVHAERFASFGPGASEVCFVNVVDGVEFVVVDTCYKHGQPRVMNSTVWMRVAGGAVPVQQLVKDFRTLTRAEGQR